MKNQKLNILILGLMSIAVLYFVLKDDFNNIIDSITKINVAWLLLACFLFGLYLFFQTLSMANLARNVETKLSLKTLFYSVIVCNFFSAITPSATGGQPFQIYFLKKKGLKLSTSTNLVLEQFTLYQIALVLLGLIAILINYFHPLYQANNLLKQLVTLGFLINTGVILVLLYISFGKKSKKSVIFGIIHFLHKIKIIKHKEEKIKKMDEMIDNFHESATALNKDHEALVKGVIYNLISLLSLYIIPIVLVYSISAPNSLNPINTIVSSAYVMMIGSFVPIPGGSGGLEFAFADFFGHFIAPHAILMAVLLLWRFVTYYLGILIGVVVMFFDRKEVLE